MYKIYKGYSESNVRIAIANKMLCKHNKSFEYRLPACLQHRITKTALFAAVDCLHCQFKCIKQLSDHRLWDTYPDLFFNSKKCSSSKHLSTNKWSEWHWQQSGWELSAMRPTAITHHPTFCYSSSVRSGQQPSVISRKFVTAVYKIICKDRRFKNSMLLFSCRWNHFVQNCLYKRSLLVENTLPQMRLKKRSWRLMKNVTGSSCLWLRNTKLT